MSITRKMFTLKRYILAVSSHICKFSLWSWELLLPQFWQCTEHMLLILIRDVWPCPAWENSKCWKGLCFWCSIDSTAEVGLQARFSVDTLLSNSDKALLSSLFCSTGNLGCAACLMQQPRSHTCTSLSGNLWEVEHLSHAREYCTASLHWYGWAYIGEHKDSFCKPIFLLPFVSLMILSLPSSAWISLSVYVCILA